jgi:hypothetical protein
MPDIIDWLSLALDKIEILPPISEEMKSKMNKDVDQCVSGQTALFQAIYGEPPVKNSDDLVMCLRRRASVLGLGGVKLTPDMLKNIVEFVLANQPEIMQVTSKRYTHSPWVTLGHATGDPGDILSYFKRGCSSLALDPIKIVNVPEGTEKQRTELIVEKKKLEARIKEIKTELRLEQ